MPRLLSNDLCSVVIEDRISNTRMKLFYRMPTTEERVSFANRRFDALRASGQKEAVEGETVTAIRLEYGMRIIAGFQKGAFSKPGPDGNEVVISSKEGDEGYEPGWADFVKTYAADIVERLAFHVFENAISTVAGGEPDPF